MTHSGGKPHTNVGDKGQRYEVSYCNHKGQRCVFGWSETLKGAEVFESSIFLHPSMSDPKIRDRENIAKEAI